MTMLARVEELKKPFLGCAGSKALHQVTIEFYGVWVQLQSRIDVQQNTAGGKQGSK